MQSQFLSVSTLAIEKIGRNVHNWKVHEMQSSHLPMVNHANELAGLFLEAGKHDGL
jgi:hypothetical protein